MNVPSHACAAALQVLSAKGALQGFFQGWFSALMLSRPNGKMKHFRRLHDKKVCSLRTVGRAIAKTQASGHNAALCCRWWR
jgi:hypothetical protein